jgi:hypothetical protein
MMKPQVTDKLFFGASLFILGLAIGLLCVGREGGVLTLPAQAQTMRMAFTGQIDKDIYGIMMVDVDAGTLWIYQYRKQGNQLKLLAARSWLYDRYLEEYNCSPPTPSEVSQLIAAQEQKIQNNPATAPAEEEGR